MPFLVGSSTPPPLLGYLQPPPPPRGVNIREIADDYSLWFPYRGRCRFINLSGFPIRWVQVRLEAFGQGVLWNLP